MSFVIPFWSAEIEWKVQSTRSNTCDFKWYNTKTRTSFVGIDLIWTLTEVVHHIAHLKASKLADHYANPICYSGDLKLTFQLISSHWSGHFSIRSRPSAEPMDGWVVCLCVNELGPFKPDLTAVEFVVVSLIIVNREQFEWRQDFALLIAGQPVVKVNLNST